MQKSLLGYLSLAPVAAVVFTSVVLTIFILINNTTPDLLSLSL
ncbi:MAG: Photosystem I reaction center subunit IX [Leptolyngbyaceae bacterium]|nr:Photosystem I reaction center subunit IX [Leptolyngbyaceae bacterium]